MIEISSFLDTLSPLKHFSQAEYTSIWQVLFKTILSGFWARLIASISLFLAFWFSVYRKRFLLGAVFFLTAVSITYLGGLLKIIFWWGF